MGATQQESPLGQLAVTSHGIPPEPEPDAEPDPVEDPFPDEPDPDEPDPVDDPWPVDPLSLPASPPSVEKLAVPQ